jgi:hypothetical protein
LVKQSNINYFSYASNFDNIFAQKYPTFFSWLFINALRLKFRTVLLLRLLRCIEVT